MRKKLAPSAILRNVEKAIRDKLDRAKGVVQPRRPGDERRRVTILKELLQEALLAGVTPETETHADLLRLLREHRLGHLLPQAPVFQFQ